MTHPRPPELESLRLLVAVGKTGSLGQAGQQEGISQPAASKRIAGLERTLGVPLVVRTPRGSALTSEGTIVADWARQVLDTVDQLLGAVASLRASTPTDLRVGASMTVAEHLVPGWLFELRRAHPDLHIGLRVANSDEVQRLVLGREVDLGFVETPSIDPRLTSKEVARDRLAVVVAPGHPWARRRKPLRRDELTRTPLVVREPGSGTRYTLDRLLDEDTRAAPLLELGSNAAVKGTVLAGAGAAVLSVLAVAAELDTGRLVEARVEDVDLSRRLLAIWPRGSQLASAAAALLQTATRYRRAR